MAFFAQMVSAQAYNESQDTMFYSCKYAAFHLGLGF